jgi:hypothetical protein
MTLNDLKTVSAIVRVLERQQDTIARHEGTQADRLVVEPLVGGVYMWTENLLRLVANVPTGDHTVMAKALMGDEGAEWTEWDILTERVAGLLNHASAARANPAMFAPGMAKRIGWVVEAHNNALKALMV